VNYLVTRDLIDDIYAYEHSVIDHQTLIVRREIKWGETQDFDQHQCGYAKCQHKYKHEWKALYTIPERKLMGKFLYTVDFAPYITSIQSIWCKMTHALRADRPLYVLPHTEWVDYLSAGGEQGLETRFVQWIALRGHTSTAVYL
jgi:hypothetical protein